MTMTLLRNLLKSGSRFNAASALLIVIVLAGCASAEMTTTRSYTGATMPRPRRILVYDFSSHLSDVPLNSPMRNQWTGLRTYPPAEHADLSQRMGKQMANDLAAKIRAMGLPGERAMRSTTAQSGDIVIKGYFSTLVAGSAAERMALGFGSGAAELKVTVEGYQMTDQGLRFLGSKEGSAASGKTPGTALSLGVAVASANPVGLIVSSAAKAAGEASGKETIEGAAKRTTDLIAARLQTAFVGQGWI